MNILPTGAALLAAVFFASCVVQRSLEPYVALGEDTGLENWTHLDGRPAEWTRLESGVVEVKPGSGNIITRVLYGDCLIELDFMTPYMPDRTGQGRGNSGAYVQGLYEVQVLDSFGNEPGMDTCGAIYKVSPAAVNVCLPPGKWQHYRIEFTAPRFDVTGAVTKKARISVWQNGTQIQDDVEVPGPTGGAAGQDLVAFGPLMLQDHGDPVRYRNVLITPRFDEDDNVGWGVDPENKLFIE